MKLEYVIKTKPEGGLQVEQKGEIQVVISNTSNERVTLQQLYITIPIGSDAQQITERSGIVCQPMDDNWVASGDGTDGQYVIKPRDGKPLIVDIKGFAIHFTDFTVNEMVGSSKLYITEETIDSNNAVSTNSLQLQINKFLNEFLLANFIVTPPEIYPGQKVKLSWDLNPIKDYSLRLKWPQNPIIEGTDVRNTSVYPSGNQPSLILYETTAFTLEAIVPINGKNKTIQLQKTASILKPHIDLHIFPTDLTLGQTATLTWTVTGANIKSVLLADEEVPSTGTRPVVLSESHPEMTYTMTVLSPNGGVAEQAIATVKLREVEIISFTKSPDNAIFEGDKVTLSWAGQDHQNLLINRHL